MELEKNISLALENIRKIIKELEKERTILYEDYYNDSNDLTADITYTDIELISSQILELEKAYLIIRDSQYLID